MNKKWIAHCRTEEDREIFRQRLAYSQDVLNVLKNILKDKSVQSAKDRRSLKSYLVHNYSEYQADRNATERTIQEIIDLLPILEK